MKIVTAAQMREIDRACARAGTPVDVLMENAGRAVARETRRGLGALAGKNVLCLVGAGNNGGDGLVAARCLREWGAEVTVYLCAGRPADDANLRLARERGVACIEARADKGRKKLVGSLASADCVIDALLGTGRMRPLEGVFRDALEKVAEARRQRDIFTVAVDMPSGLDADTGAVDPVCPCADLTVTLAFPKPGLFISPGTARVGRLVVADIGIPASLAGDTGPELMTEDWARQALPARPPDANKGTFGRVMAVAGSPGYVGAACLAASAVLRAGAGLVTLAVTEKLQQMIVPRLVEATYLLLPEGAPSRAAGLIARGCAGYDWLLLGCGLGRQPSAVTLVKSLLSKKGLPPFVIDADGLNIISELPAWWRRLPAAAVLTPHPGEMARLTGLTVAEVQADRINVAGKYAVKWGKTVVLKGAHTVVAAPDGRSRVSPFANAGLASAGTGDVLAGTIAGLAAQGLPPFEAASLGAYLHGAAGEMLKETLGDAGLMASDLLPALPLAMKRLKERG